MLVAKVFLFKAYIHLDFPRDPSKVLPLGLLTPGLVGISIWIEGYQFGLLFMN